MIPAWLNIALVALYLITVGVAVIVVLRENRNPIRSLAWVIALIFLPYVGLIFYIFFGRSLRGRRMVSRHSKRKMVTAMAPRHVDLDTQDLDDSEKSLVKLARNISSSIYSDNNAIRVFTVGSTTSSWTIISVPR